MAKNKQLDEEQEEQLEQIIGELKSRITYETFRDVQRERYEERLQIYMDRMKEIRETELPEKEKEWRKNLTTILRNVDIIETYIDSGKEFDIEKCEEFIQSIEQKGAKLLQSKTLRKIYNRFKERIKDYQTSK